MTQFLEIILPDGAEPAGLCEQLARWGDGSFPFDPPRFVFGSVPLVRDAARAHLPGLLPPALRDGTALSLDEAWVLDWSQGRLPADQREQLRRLVDALAPLPHWAIVYERSAGEGSAVFSVDARDAFARIDRAIQHEPERDLTIVLPTPPRHG